MCVDLDAFYPSCEELRDSSLIGKPHATIMTDQQDGNNITKGVVASGVPTIEEMDYLRGDSPQVMDW